MGCNMAPNVDCRNRWMAMSLGIKPIAKATNSKIIAVIEAAMAYPLANDTLGKTEPPIRRIVNGTINLALAMPSVAFLSKPLQSC